jgi:hypothetical protein
MYLDLVPNIPTYRRDDGVGGSHQLVDVDSAQTLTSKTLTAPVLNAPTLTGVKAANVASGTGVVLTAAQSGAILLFDSATAALLYTLPAPAFGLTFTFIWTVSVTSGTSKVITDASGTKLMGAAYLGIAAGTGTTFYADGTTHRSLNANGTTTGGLLGGIAYFYCVTGTQWEVDVVVEGSSTIATPFATT